MRDQLIRAAIEKFGKRGFDAVGTREIAAAVGTPMSSITYHFGGKEGLYLAAAEYIFDYMQEIIGPIDPADFPAGRSREQRIDAMVEIMRRMGAFMLDERSAPFALFIGREQQDPTPKALEMMDAKVMPIMRVLVGEVGAIRPGLTPDEAKAITLYLFGMVIALRHTRASMSLLFGTDTFEGPVQTMLLDQLEGNLRAILGEERA